MAGAVKRGGVLSCGPRSAWQGQRLRAAAAALSRRGTYQLGEELGLHDERLRHLALAEHLEIARVGHIDDRRLAGGGVDVADEGEQAVDVDGRAVVAVAHEVEMAHAHLAKVARVELVEESAVVVLATGVTAATRVRAVLADAAVACGHVAALLAVLGETGRHFG